MTGYIILILGVAIWWAAHLFKRMAPARRAAMGDRGRGAVAIALVAGIVLMVLGYRAAPVDFLWAGPPWLVHLNNLLVLIAFFMMSPAPKRGRVLNGMRHPMLTGFALWAIAHLLVNGDVASVILFGGLLLWVPVQIAAINGAEPDWTPPAPGTYGRDVMFLAGSAVLMAVIGYIHYFLGRWPFAS